MCTPGPAVAGLNVPVVPFVIPVPDQVPPGSAAVKFTAGSVWQKGPAGEIVGSQVDAQAGRRLGSVMTMVDPTPSVTCNGILGGVMVTPEPKYCQLVTFTAQPPGKLHPMIHPLQSCVVTCSSQSKGPVPLVIVISPFVSTQAVKFVQGLTTT